jgi:hypothetical protein
MSARGIVGPGIERLQLRRVAGDDPDLVADFRRRVFLDRRQLVLDDEREAERDRQGYVFALSDAGVMVGTTRVLPYPSEHSPLRALGADVADANADSEIGRIACVEAPGARYLLAMMTLGAAWLRQHTRLSRYVAHCHPKLARLYGVVGARDLGRELHLAGRADTHRIIAGAYRDAERSGGALLGLWGSDGPSVDVHSQPPRLAVGGVG